MYRLYNRVVQPPKQNYQAPGSCIRMVPRLLLCLCCFDVLRWRRRLGRRAGDRSGRGGLFSALTPPCCGVFDGNNLRAVDIRDARGKPFGFEDVEFAAAYTMRGAELGDFECATLAAAGRVVF